MRLEAISLLVTRSLLLSRHFDSFISDSPRSPSFQHTSGDALQDEFGYGPYPYGTSSRRMSSLSSVSSMPRFSAPYSERPPGSPLHNSTLASQASSSEEPVFIWHTSDPEPDDALHDPSIPYTRNGKVVHDRFVLCSVRGWMNIGMLLLLAGALLMLFLGYPSRKQHWTGPRLEIMTARYPLLELEENGFHSQAANQHTLPIISALEAMLQAISLVKTLVLQESFY
ncbi:glycoside hydrolase family 16 [Pyrrhoderma noxium]|uniref:Glycoside hydrolase family 16 n=1 Tax=Pyrrhoderma noxium TaxID=2282107 RepID=A0A286UIV8_9AGAM|nr:glycoside hydrolase family 16 [Pyrrhoderma noxium]